MRWATWGGLNEPPRIATLPRAPRALRRPRAGHQRTDIFPAPRAHALLPQLGAVRRSRRSSTTSRAVTSTIANVGGPPVGRAARGGGPA